MIFKIQEVYVSRLIAQQIASNNARREALRLDAMIAASRQGKNYLNVFKGGFMNFKIWTGIIKLLVYPT